MKTDSLDIKELDDGLSVKVRLQPRSSRNKIVGISGDSLKLCITSPPVDGEANAACLAYFANLFNIAKTKVIILSGQKSRSKVLKLVGVSMEEFHRVLADQIDKNKND